MAENTTQRYFTDAQVAKIKLTASVKIVSAEEKLKRAEELKAKFDVKADSMMKDYNSLKQIYPSLAGIGIRYPELLDWYQDLTNKIKDLRAAINKAKDNNVYKMAANIEQNNEQTEHLIRDLLAVCEELANDPLLKESIANGDA